MILFNPLLGLVDFGLYLVLIFALVSVVAIVAIVYRSHLTFKGGKSPELKIDPSKETDRNVV